MPQHNTTTLSTSIQKVYLGRLEMKKVFSQNSFSQNFLQKLSLLLLVVFLGGCQLVPAPFFQYLLGDNTGITVYTDYTDYPTMYFTVNSDATSLTLYTTTSTNTLSYTDGDYKWGTYEGENFKLQLFNVDLKGGTFKLYKNGTLIDEDDFIWWIGDIDLKSYTRVLDTVEGRTMMHGLSFSEDGKHIFGFNVVTYHEDIVIGSVHKKNVVTEEMNLYLKEFTKEYVTYTNDIISGDDTIPITVTINDLTDESFKVTILAETKDCYISRTTTSYFVDDPEILEDYKLIENLDYIHNSYGYNFTVSDDFKTVHDNRNDTTYTYFGYNRYNSDRTYYQFNRYAFDVQANTITRVIIYLYQYDSNKSKFTDGYMYSYPQSTTVTPK